MFAGQLALIAAAIFAGGALHVTLSEQPARLGLDDRAMLVQWQPSFARAKWMAAPLAIAGFLLGLLAWWRTGDWAWSIGAVLIGAIIPFTLVAIGPTNARLVTTPPDGADKVTRALIERWGWLHGLRTGMALVATGALAWAAMR